MGGRYVGRLNFRFAAMKDSRATTTACPQVSSKRCGQICGALLRDAMKVSDAVTPMSIGASNHRTGRISVIAAS